MTRLARFTILVALLSGAACASDSPTSPTPNTLTPSAGPSFVESDTTCRGGYNNANGKSC